MQAETRKRGPKSRADKTAHALDVAMSAIAQDQAASESDAAPASATAPTFEPVAAATTADVQPLNEYIQARERDFAPLVQITHPQADEGTIHAGVYSGIRLKKGPCQALYSDGTTE